MRRFSSPSSLSDAVFGQPPSSKRRRASATMPLLSVISLAPLSFSSFSALFLRILTLQSLADDALALVLAALLALERLAVQVFSAEASIAAQHFFFARAGRPLLSRLCLLGFLASSARWILCNEHAPLALGQKTAEREERRRFAENRKS